jgi:hypothetical protein
LIGDKFNPNDSGRSSGRVNILLFFPLDWGLRPVGSTIKSHWSGRMIVNLLGRDQYCGCCRGHIAVMKIQEENKEKERKIREKNYLALTCDM